MVSFQRGWFNLKDSLCNLKAYRNINSTTAVLSLTHLEASPLHRLHKILADRCSDAFQKAVRSDWYLYCGCCALLASVLPAVQGCYGCYSLGGLPQGFWHKDVLTSCVLVCLCKCVCLHAWSLKDMEQRFKQKFSKAMLVFVPATVPSQGYLPPNDYCFPVYWAQMWSPDQK